MKKQFLRVKQLADQTFRGPGKTEVLSDDLQCADKKVEFMRSTCQLVTKRLSACLAGSPQKEGKDATLRKRPEWILGVALEESIMQYDDDCMLKEFLSDYSVVEKCEAENNNERDSLIEVVVLSYLQDLLNNEFPSVVKHKKNLQKCFSDVESARTRLSQAQKSVGGTQMSKTESIKDELSDCEVRLEQAKDALACDIFHIAIKEPDLCQHLLQICKIRKSHHEQALKRLNGMVDKLEKIQCDFKMRKIFGLHVEEHLRITKRKIAYPIELCVCALIQMGLEEEGLFRIAASSTRVKRMKLSLEAGCLTLPAAMSYRDPHIVADVLKAYLRELPEPLTSRALHERWIAAGTAQIDQQEKLQELWKVLYDLPETHFENLAYLCRFFHKLSQYQDQNKMSPANLAIVIAPSLMGVSGSSIDQTAISVTIVQYLIEYADWFFPNEMEFFRTLEQVHHELDGIDNKGYDPKTPPVQSANVPPTFSELKRSQSADSLLDEPPNSPRPVIRKKNKAAAPVPPVSKANNNPVNATLPRRTATHKEPKKTENKATETKNDVMTQSLDSQLLDSVLKEDIGRDQERTSRRGREKKNLVTVSTNTEEILRNKPLENPEKDHSEYKRKDVQQLKEQWLLQSHNQTPSKPIVPERPANLRPQLPRPTNPVLSNHDNYENVIVSSNESLGPQDERTLQKTQIWSIDKQQISIIDVKKKKRERSRDKEKKSSSEEVGSFDENDDDLDVVIRKSSHADQARPSSLPGNDRPERPPKPEILQSSPSSHARTASDGSSRTKMTDKPSGKLSVVSVIKHPSTSPPPPPVPAKPSKGVDSDSDIGANESTDF